MINSKIYTTIHSPCNTEKTFKNAEVDGKFVFRVAKDATKHSVKRAVEKMFNVSVTAVNMLNVKGKKRMFKKHVTKTVDWKKAIVTLAEGQYIDYTKLSEVK